MIRLLVPLGLLGLIGILILILIYIIKPNYQTRHVSSTYIWRLSLKRKRKKLPINKIRNILIFICQLLILTAAALILAMPVLADETTIGRYDVIAIIDSSASMYAGKDGDTRFTRAVEEVDALSDSVLSDGGTISVIVADDSPEYLFERAGAEKRADVAAALQALAEDEYACYFGESDVEEAMRLTEKLLEENPSAQIYFFTDVEYEYIPDGLNVVSVADEGEWNAAILDATAELTDGFYTLTVEVACYGKDLDLDLEISITGANSADADDPGREISILKTASCEGDKTKKIVFRREAGEDTDDTEFYVLDLEQQFYSYHTIHITFADTEDDSFTIDNNFDIYGGQKEILRVQYASSMPNPFFAAALDTLRKRRESDYNLQVSEVPVGQTPALEGFDYYIFEHVMPQEMPTDGAVFLVDPDYAPDGSDFRVNGIYAFRQEMALTAGEADHPVLHNVRADNITVTQYTQLTYDPSYTPLLFCDESPVLLVKKEREFQAAILSFSVHYSTIAVTEFYTIMRNLFDYFFPTTVEKNTFDVGEEFDVNSKGPTLSVQWAEGEQPSPLHVPGLSVPGTYTIQPSSYFKDSMDAVSIYVRIPSEESNIKQVKDALTAPYRERSEGFRYDDLLIYLAAAAVVILFLEWWLQWRENK